METFFEYLDFWRSQETRIVMYALFFILSIITILLALSLGIVCLALGCLVGLVSGMGLVLELSKLEVKAEKTESDNE